MYKILLSALAVALLTPPAFAENKAQSVEVKPAEENPVTEWMNAENKLIDTLNKSGKESFLVLRNKHSAIRSVRLVERDVGNAVTACGKANPDLKKDMDARFKDWQNAINPIIKDAERFLKQEIDEQQLVYPTDFRHVMTLNDKAYEFSEKQVIKEVVTSEEACKNLLESMDRTEDRLVNLLQDILIPENVIRERTGE